MQARDVAKFVINMPFIRGKKGSGGTPMVPTDIDIEAVDFRVESRFSQMPFADMKGVVTGFFESFCQSDFLQRKIAFTFGGNHGPIKLGSPQGMLTPDGHAKTGWVLAGHYGSSGGSADRRGRIGTGKLDSRRGESIQVRRFVQIRTVSFQIVGTQVICHNENDIKRTSCLRLCQEPGYKQEAYY